MSTATLSDLLRATRAHSLNLAAPLTSEDAQLQSMPDASPAKWHLAHTTWFFETLVLEPHLPDYCVFDERWPRLFNSYYESLGPRHARPQRGLLSRPGLAEVKAYRAHVDAALADLLPHAPDHARALVELGCHHEQQHQELLLTDILHAFSCNPLLPAYDATAPAKADAPIQAWLRHDGGIVDIGHGGGGFAFDNEGPRHQALLAPFEISNRLVTCGEYADFIDAGGYREPLLWLSDGWAAVQAQGWQRPAYWLEDGSVFGLHGVQPLDPNAPVQQLSFYEACAFAEWAGARLPTEFEWEAACQLPGFANAADQAWQWTRSSYAPYPGFRPAAGAVGEYNGKFMVGQQVLRGGSLATPPGHVRPSYRNFFPPAARWQFSGVRLAR
ncbi:MAG: ergothioneine biosynthesis protein EgtB [Burkholderiales bacterium]|jgi:ergothioneine biosynthesis protein EgtB|nr:ergothioneine biosynthesis protein EgtB [Burkholderiales bacterium]